MSEWIWEAAGATIEPFTNPSNRLSYVYMATALFVAAAVYLSRSVRAGEARVAGLLNWLLPREIVLHPSAQVDYCYYFVNKFLGAAVWSSAMLGSHHVYGAVSGWLTQAFGDSPDRAPSVLATVVATLCIVTAVDGAIWFAHWLFHRVPILWEFHKVHHSAEVMTPITAARMHPFEEVVDASLAAIATGTTIAVFDHVMGSGMRVLSLFDLNIVTAAFFLAAFNLRHSHVWVRYPTWLQHILICPAQHQIHHSRARQHWDRNMGFIFAFWDWAAGTLYAPRGREELTFGLGTEEDGTWRSVRVLYFRPLARAWAMLQPRAGARSVNPPAE